VNVAFLSLLCVMIMENVIKVQEMAQSRAACTEYTGAALASTASEHTLGEALLPIGENWPSSGDILVQDLTLRYSLGAPLVLCGVSFHLSAGTRAGCVGRTGAGKSSLIAALTRLVEPSAGSVIIDGVDVLRLPDPEELRSRLGTMSQDCLFFTGTIRHNLDPWAQHTEKTLQGALSEVGLELELHTALKSMGANLSVGQRHLLSVARLLLTHPRVVLLDEPTAHLDPVSADKVLKTLRRVLPSATVLHVAHHLETIVEYDEVLVVDEGIVKEQGAPWKLLQSSEGIFTSLVNARGPHAASALMKTAERHRPPIHSGGARLGCC